MDEIADVFGGGDDQMEMLRAELADARAAEASLQAALLATTEDLVVANERGDGWRDEYADDTVTIEKLRAQVVALLERLERAEAALDVVEERLCTEVAIAVTLGQSGYTPAYSVLAEALEDTVEALVAAGRGVTGLQEPEKAEEES